MHRDEKSISEMSRQLKRSRDAIRRYLSDRNGYGNRSATRGSSKLTPSDRRRILREGRKGATSASKIKSDLNLSVSTRRVQQILSSDENLVYKQMKRKPPLTVLHVSARLNWARERHAWTPAQWGRVVFSDEKKWNLDGPDGYACYWHDLRNEEHLLSRRQKGGGGVMIWAAFSEHGYSEIAFLSGNQDSKKYTGTLENYLMPFVRKHYPGSYIFQQDNAPIHTSHHTRKWFQDNSVNVMPWPAKSPDLNPIENLWGILCRRVYSNGRQFDNVADLKECVKKEWDKLEYTTRYNLVRSMSNRCRDLLQAGGKSINY